MLRWFVGPPWASPDLWEPHDAQDLLRTWERGMLL